MNKKFIQNKRQSGAVSLFVVIFAALLMSVVTVGFVQLMVKDQQQATANDLSQSAYDSAQAGVEDAKRLLLAQQAACVNSADADCVKYTNAIKSNACNTLERGGMSTTTNGETLVQQSASDNKLDQAYTCVKITPNTKLYQNALQKDGSVIVPLRAADASGNPVPFDTVVINWFDQRNLPAGATSVTQAGSGAAVTLPPVGAAWKSTTPPLVRTQLIQTGKNFKLSDFDSGSNASTLFLYPNVVSSPIQSSLSFALDTRQAPGATMAPQPVACANALSVSVEYACSAKLTLTTPANGTTADGEAYLRLSALYNDANFTLSLYNGPTQVLFRGVQPQVDSTGRANNLFRRVQASVELSGAMSYPEAAVDLAGGLCKNFIVTNTATDYVNSATGCSAP